VRPEKKEHFKYIRQVAARCAFETIPRSGCYCCRIVISA